MSLPDLPRGCAGRTVRAAPGSVGAPPGRPWPPHTLVAHRPVPWARRTRGCWLLGQIRDHVLRLCRDTEERGRTSSRPRERTRPWLIPGCPFDSQLLVLPAQAAQLLLLGAAGPITADPFIAVGLDPPVADRLARGPELPGPGPQEMGCTRKRVNSRNQN